MLHPCKSTFRPSAVFKFDSVKFSGTIEKLNAYIKNIKFSSCMRWIVMFLINGIHVYFKNFLRITA